MMLMRLLMLFSILIAGACAHTVPQAEAVKPAEPFTLSVTESAAIPGDGMLQFSEVVSDSRCPVGVQCAWAGEGVIALRITDEEGSAELRLRTPGGPAAEFSNWRVELLELRPQPREGVALRQADYEAVLMLRELN